MVYITKQSNKGDAMYILCENGTTIRDNTTLEGLLTWIYSQFPNFLDTYINCVGEIGRFWHNNNIYQIYWRHDA
jgi:hypothetical protein